MSDGWFDVPSGDSRIVKYTRSKEYSEDFKAITDKFFGSLMVNPTEHSTEPYTRGFQILYLLGLDSLVTPYWDNMDSIIQLMKNDIPDTKSLEQLKELGPEHSIYAKRTESIIKESKIDNTIIDIVNQETEGIGGLRDTAKGLLYYYTILGETASSGGTTV